MSTTRSLFVTRLYRAALSDMGKPVDPADLEAACLSVAEDDAAGQAWCDEHDFPGYTSYASLTDLPWRMPVFKGLKKALDKHVAAFAKDLCFDLADKKLRLDSLWINILPAGGIHTGHLHTHSVISGTTYVAMPEGTSAIRFEDPRLPMMMAAPGRAADAPEKLRHVRLCGAKGRRGAAMGKLAAPRGADEHDGRGPNLGEFQLRVVCLKQTSRLRYRQLPQETVRVAPGAGKVQIVPDRQTGFYPAGRGQMVG